MNTIPNFIRIAEIVFAWHNGIITDDEAHAKIQLAMSPENFIPRDEVCSAWPQHGEPLIQNLLLRVEEMLNALSGGSEVSSPGTCDPKTLSERVKMLAEQGDTIYAVKEHRDRTGAGLAETVDLIKGYLRDRGAKH